MRLFGTMIVICMLVCNVVAASAQSYCPFLAFCGAQQGHCYGSCGTLAEVIDRAPTGLETKLLRQLRGAVQQLHGASISSLLRP